MARGALELLWESCYESGEDYVGTSDDIENLVGWKGDAGMLTRALIEAGAPEGQGFIEPVSGTVDGAVAYRVHDLWHHAPDYVAKRRQRELARQKKVAPGGVRRTAPNGADLPGSAKCQDESRVTPSPSHSPSHSHKNVSAETSSAPPPAAYLVFPVIGSGTGEWLLSEAQVAEWADLYPGVDVRGECRKAVAWVRAKPGHRKTGGGMKTFLVRWLNKSVDERRGPMPVSAQPANRPPASPAVADYWDNLGGKAKASA
jgi:hypothetical protein